MVLKTPLAVRFTPVTGGFFTAELFLVTTVVLCTQFVLLTVLVVVELKVVFGAITAVVDCLSSPTELTGLVCGVVGLAAIGRRHRPSLRSLLLADLGFLPGFLLGPIFFTGPLTTLLTCLGGAGVSWGMGAIVTQLLTAGIVVGKLGCTIVYEGGTMECIWTIL